MLKETQPVVAPLGGNAQEVATRDDTGEWRGMAVRMI